jgi:hypothetical protein
MLDLALGRTSSRATIRDKRRCDENDENDEEGNLEPEEDFVEHHHGCLLWSQRTVGPRVPFGIAENYLLDARSLEDECESVVGRTKMRAPADG